MKQSPILRSSLCIVALLGGLSVTASAADQILVVVGASGGQPYEEQFQQWADAWRELAVQAEAELRLIGLEAGEGHDRDQIEQFIRTVVADPPPRVWIVLIGHGTYTQGVAKFNLRGPDVSATEFAEWLSGLSSPLVFVNCASSSAPFINELSGAGRVIVTATRSGTEQNFARFGKFFATALSVADADLDHDDEVSVLEAFLRGAADVRQFYEAENRLATEHPLLDDNGDGKGTPPTLFRAARPVGAAADDTPLDGLTAARITLVPIGQRFELTQEEQEQRAEIEDQLERLRMEKEELSEQAYQRSLEPLMIRLAEIYQAAESRGQAEE